MKAILWICIIFISLLIGACTVNNNLASQGNQTSTQSSIYKQGKFHNHEPISLVGFSKLGGMLVRYFTDKSDEARPKQVIPVEKLSRQSLEALSDSKLHVIKLGHSSVLLKVYGEYWLLDPVFSNRASPFSFLGPKRFHQTPITIDELPAIDRVLISHNHYDHLDKSSVEKLADKTIEFLVPLGIKEDLKRWGVSHEKITEFDWWQEQSIKNGLVAFTPTQHFSGRALSDGNKTLWGSWVIKSHGDRLYFSGDSGYFSGFKAIGEKYGPFDLTMIETGAYDKDWPDVHMTPEESVQAHLVKGKVMMPIHNGTFDLAFHAWYEPLERVYEASMTQHVPLFTPIVGQVNQLTQSMPSTRWWRDVVEISGDKLAYNVE